MPSILCLLLAFAAAAWSREGPLRRESFDREPPGWEGINNRNPHFPPRTVTQDFGYSASTNHAGGRPGEVGGKLNPAGEVAYYGYRLPEPLTLDDPFDAAGRILVPRGPGHFLLGLFNAGTANEWRTRNTMAARINGRGDGFHCHIEYSTDRWRSEAGVMGSIVRGERIEAVEIPADRVYEWRLAYDPKGTGGAGLLTFSLNGKTAACSILEEHRGDGATFTHFGLLPVPKTWDSPGEAWIDDVTVNGKRFEFSEDPRWDASNNRRTYETLDTRPRFDFGWSPTHHGGGKAAGELGGLIFRGDCREPARMGAYGDRLSTLTLDMPLEARGKVAMLRGVSDSTAFIGFYHSAHSMRSNPSQAQGIPMDSLGVHIEGPSSEGFFFYPVYRAHGDAAGAAATRGGKAPRIHPDRKAHDWELRYDPAGANGKGRITVALDGQTATLDLDAPARRMGASFDRFGICTTWIDGNSVTAFFDDLEYTCQPPGRSASSPRRELLRRHLADYDAELRGPDGRVDADAMVRRLRELGVGTYYWLIWHAATDWDDLKLFLPKAREAEIDVWVYLVPPSESPPMYGNQYSEPFRLDYARWGEEIARLSLEHPNLTAWVIDDFHANREFFTPARLREIRARAGRIQPKLAFLPLMYFDEMRTSFVEEYRPVIDGVVVAYLQDREEIETTWAILNDAAVSPPSELVHPWSTPSREGDFVAASQSASVLPADRYALHVRERDDFTGATSGYHFKQVLVDGAVAWEEDVAGGSPAWRKLDVDVTPHVRGKRSVSVTFRLLDRKAVSNFGVRWRLSELRAEGLEVAADLAQPQRWKVERQGAFEAGFGEVIKGGRRSFHIPFISMVAGDAGEFRQRHGDPATPQRIAEQIGMSLQAWQDGKCDGVVTYCLDKRPQSQTFPRAQKLFRDSGVQDRR